jgi:hypothetical protein
MFGMKKFLALLALLWASAAFAQSTTNVTWGLITGSEPRALCIYDTSATRQCLQTGTINSTTHIYTPLALPGATDNVSNTGIPGLSGGHWMIRTNPGIFDPTQTLRVDRVVSGTGTAGGFVYPTLLVNTTTSVTGNEYEWGLLAQMHNMAPAAGGAENVALQGTIFKDVPTNTVATTGASGTGTQATVTFSGGATIPGNVNGVSGHSVKITGVTPSAYNGTWKVLSSAAGSVTFASAATGAQTVAGTLVDISVTSSWGMNSNCVINNNENDPVASCLGAEIDITNNGSIPTTDNGNVNPVGYGERVGLQVQFNGTGANAGSHAGRAILIGAGSSNIWDRGIAFQNNYGTGIDFTQATISGPAIGLAANQKIAFDATAPSGVETFARYLSFDGTSFGYTTGSGRVFSVSDAGNITTPGTVGTSGTPITKVYASNIIVVPSQPTISACGTSPPAASGASSNASGRFTLGTGATTACTVTFLTAYPTNAFCTVTPASAYTGTYYISAQDKTGFTVTLGTGTASVIFQYTCAGN